MRTRRKICSIASSPTINLTLPPWDCSRMSVTPSRQSILRRPCEVTGSFHAKPKDSI